MTSFLSSVASFFWKSSPKITVNDKAVPESSCDQNVPATKAAADPNKAMENTGYPKTVDRMCAPVVDRYNCRRSGSDFSDSTFGDCRDYATDKPYFHSTPYQRATELSSEKNRKEKEPSKFNGKSDWTDYVSHFEAVAHWNKWSYDEKGLQRAISLVDEAREVLIGIDDRYDFNTLCDVLGRRFSPDGRECKFALELMNRQCQKHEDVTTYGHAIRRLALKAYPGQKLDEKFLVDLFIRGLSDVDMKRHVYLHKHITLAEAINSAVAYEAFDTTKRHINYVEREGRLAKPHADRHLPPCVNAVQTDHTVSDLMKLVKETNETLNSLVNRVDSIEKQNHPKGQQSDRSQVRPNKATVRCFKCNGLGHYASECPKGSWNGRRTVNNTNINDAGITENPLNQ